MAGISVRSMKPRALGGAILCLALLTGAKSSTLITVELEEKDGRSLVKIRSSDGALEEPKVVASRTGMLLVFPGDKISAERIYSSSPRLRYVQTGDTGRNAAIRLVQRKDASGRIREFVRQKLVDGGIDLEVVPSHDPPPPPPDPEPIPSRADTLAALSKDLDKKAAEDVPPQASPASPLPPPEAQPTIRVEGEVLDEKTERPQPVGEADHQQAQPTTSPIEGPETPEDPAESQAAGTLSDPLDLSGETPQGSPLFGDSSKSPEAASPWSMMGSILLLVSAAGGALWLRRKGRISVPGSRGMEIIDRISVGPKQQIVSVRVSGREFLVGMTEHQVQLLADLSAPMPVTPAPEPITELTKAPSPTLVSGTPPATPRAPRSQPGTLHDLLMGAVPQASATTPGSDQPAEQVDRAAVGAKVAAFKARLEKALNSELSNGVPEAAKGPTLVPDPNIFDVEKSDPRWVNHEEVA
jgi:flagellar biogenesis protein FliO